MENLGGAGALGERMGIEITEATPERVVATMPVEGNTQPYGLLHGGASCVLAETLGSVGAVMHGQTVDRPFAVGVDINATHHKAVRSGIVTGVATPVHRGRTAVDLRDRHHRRGRRPGLHRPAHLPAAGRLRRCGS